MTDAQLPVSPLVTINGSVDGSSDSLIARVTQALDEAGLGHAAEAYRYHAHKCDSHPKLVSLSHQYAHFV
jgi:hypothetical protein